MINMNGDLFPGQTFSGAQAGNQVPEQIHKSSTYLGAEKNIGKTIVFKIGWFLFHFHWVGWLRPAKAVDVEVKSKVEQLQVVGDCSENLKIGRKYKAEVFCGICFISFILHLCNLWLFFVS